MKKIFKPLLLLIAFIMAATSFAAGCGSTQNLNGEEAITDPYMQNGVDVLGTVSIRDGGNVFYKMRYMDTVPANVKAFWKLGQWGTKYGFHTAEMTEERDGDNYVYKDRSKEFIINPVTGQYSLNCDTSSEYEEYGSAGLPQGTEWLHLITMHTVVDISRVTEMEHIWMILDFEIPYCENLMGENLNTNIHTALFQWVFAVGNSNPDSPDYNDYFWLNLPLYDGRSLVTDEWKDFEEWTALDFGKEDKTDTYVYSADSDSYLPTGGIEIGKRYKITVDLIPFIERALSCVQTNEQNATSAYPLLMNTTADDLRITSFYIGWETPGTFNCGATIYGNSLIYDKI